MALLNRMPLCPGLLWLILNLALIIHYLSRIPPSPNFTYPVRCLRVPQVEDHWSNWFNLQDDFVPHDTIPIILRSTFFGCLTPDAFAGFCLMISLTDSNALFLVVIFSFKILFVSLVPC
jgi:hypothetical protein